jgi:KDO2-lipid IV(A) lauroyltransferase
MMAFIKKSDLPFLGFVAATLCLRGLPRSARYTWTRWAAKGLGKIWYRVDRSDAALTRRNMLAVLGGCLPAEKIEAAIPALYEHFALDKLLTDMVPTMNRADVDQVLSVEGEEHLQAALAQGRGAIFLAAHLGTFSYLPMLAVKLRGYPLVPVVGEEMPPDPSWVYKHIVYPVRAAARPLFDVINPDGTPQLKLVEALRQNKVLLIFGDVLDDDVRRLAAPNVLPAPLLGRALSLKTGPFRLAHWLNAPLIPYFVRSRAGGGFTLALEAPLELSTDRSPAGLIADLAAFTSRFEPYLLQNPELWAHWRHEFLLDVMRPAASAPAPALEVRLPQPA